MKKKFLFCFLFIALICSNSFAKTKKKAIVDSLNAEAGISDDDLAGANNLKNGNTTIKSDNNNGGAGSSKKESGAAGSKYYEKGYAGQVQTLVILEPTGLNLNKDNEWLLSFIQTQLIDNFASLSPIVISDRQNADKAQEEIDIQENGSFSDNGSGARFGEAVGASYMLTGQLTNKGSSFALSLRINDITKNTPIVTVSKNNFGASQIKSGAIVNEAFEELLDELGITLTAAGKEKLYGVSEETLKQQESLSKGINASKRGTVVEAMQYYYQAAEFNVDNLEVNARLNQMQSAISSGNLGDKARNEDEIYAYWKKTLSEAEQYFTENPPYEIIYSTDLKPLQRSVDELDRQVNTFQVDIAIIASISAKNAIDTLKAGIQSSPAAVRNAFKNWPNTPTKNGSSKWMSYSSYYVTFQLVNDMDKVISSNEIYNIARVGPSISDSSSLSLRDLENLDYFKFREVKSADLTDDLSIKVAKVRLSDKEISLDHVRIATVDSVKDSLLAAERIENERKFQEQLYYEELKKSEELQQKAAQRQENIAQTKKERAVHNNRGTVYSTCDLQFNSDLFAMGVTFGYEKPVARGLYWGFMGDFLMDPATEGEEILGYDFGGYVGFNKYSSSYATGTFWNVGAGWGGCAGTPLGGTGLYVSSTIGVDFFFVLELSYTFTYYLDQYSKDKVSFGIVVPWSAIGRY